MIKFGHLIELVRRDLRIISWDYEKYRYGKKVSINIFELYSHKEKRIMLVIEIDEQPESQKSFINFLDNYQLTWTLSHYSENKFEVIQRTRSEMMLDKL